MDDWRTSEITFQPFKWLENFGNRMRKAMGGDVTEYPVVYCDDCGKPLGLSDYWNEYEYPYEWDELEGDPANTTTLCNDCARGLFCLYCGSFTGGTEDIFLYGDSECSNCSGWREEYDDDQYYDDYDDFDGDDIHWIPISDNVDIQIIGDLPDDLPF